MLGGQWTLLQHQYMPLRLYQTSEAREDPEGSPWVHIQTTRNIPCACESFPLHPDTMIRIRNRETINVFL